VLGASDGDLSAVTLAQISSSCHLTVRAPWARFESSGRLPRGRGRALGPRSLGDLRSVTCERVGTLYKVTREPLLRALLRAVIQDEARHVHYGVLALRTHYQEALSESERREREDWAFEVALLMRNRFGGRAADQISSTQLLADLDGEPVVAPV